MVSDFVEMFEMEIVQQKGMSGTRLLLTIVASKKVALSGLG